MGILNNVLGINLTTNDPLINNPFNLSASQGEVVPPPPGFFIITETGNFIQTETGNNLLVVE